MKLFFCLIFLFGFLSPVHSVPPDPTKGDVELMQIYDIYHSKAMMSILAEDLLTPSGTPVAWNKVNVEFQTNFSEILSFYNSGTPTAEIEIRYENTGWEMQSITDSLQTEDDEYLITQDRHGLMTES